MVGQHVEVAESCHPSTMSTTALFKWLTFVFAEDHEDLRTDFLSLATKNTHIMMDTETQNTHMVPRPQPTYNTHSRTHQQTTATRTS